MEVPENSVIFNRDVNITGTHPCEPLRLVQYDKTLPVLAVSLWNGSVRYTIPTGATLRIRWHKPDGHSAFADSIGTDEHGVAYFQISQQMTAASGVGYANIEVTADGGIKHSDSIPFQVAKNAVQEGDVESTDEWQSIDEILKQVEQLKKQASDSASAAAESANAASQKAEESAQSAQQASQNKDAAASSANAANESAQRAQQAKTAADAAKNAAENAAARADKSAANLPQISQENARKYVQVNNDGTGYVFVDGTTGNSPVYKPSVSPSGDLSWTNDGGLENPPTVNIKGQKGDTPKKGTDYFTQADVEQISQKAAEQAKSTLLNTLYPIGSVYMSVNSTSPGTLFGGTWTKIEGRFLYCDSTSKQTGGAKTVNLSHTHTTANHTLTVNQIPSHNHTDADSIRWNKPNGNANLMFPGQDVGSGDYGGGTKYTGNTGGGQPHNHGATGAALTNSVSIMPPYITVHCWYRTA